MLKPSALRGLRTDTREAPRAIAQEGMFWEFVPEDVIGMPVELTNADNGFTWRVKKDRMEVATGKNLGAPAKNMNADTEHEWRVRKDRMEAATRATWTVLGWSPRPLEYALNEFWGNFWWMTEARKCSTQSRLLLCHDRDGQDQWMRRCIERWVGSKFAACMWIYTKRLLTGGLSRNGGILEATFDVHHAMHELGLCMYF